MADARGVSLRTALVVNPRAGGRRAGRARAALLEAFARAVPGGEVRETTRRGEATDIVRALLERGCECVAVAGGDGTLNEAVNGFFHEGDEPRAVSGEACLAVVPVGTGGDFRRTLGLEPDPVAALSLLTGSSTRPCDVGHATFVGPGGEPASRYFINITSFGLSGLVDEYVGTGSGRLPGSIAYFAATVRAFMNYENVRVRVVMDRAEQRVETSVLVAVANGRYFGGGMEVAPGARIADGLLDVIVMGDMGIADFIVHSGKMYGGRILDHPLVQHARASEVRIEPVDGRAVMPMDMDGEPLGRLPATLRVFRGALRIKT